MKRIIGVGLAVLLVFTAIGSLGPREAEAHNAEFYDAIRRYFAGEISQQELSDILAAQDPPIRLITTNPLQQSVTTHAPTNSSPPADPYRPADLTPWAMIKAYAASQNQGDYCTPEFTVTLPSSIRTYGGRTYTVANINYNRAYCIALDHWLATKDDYVDSKGVPNPPPRPRPEDF